MVDGAVPAFAALAAEVSTAVAAEQFGSQQIIVLGLVTGRGFSVLCQLLLNPIKQILGNDSGDSIGYEDVPVSVFPDVAAVAQHVLDAIVVQRLTTGISDTALIQPVPQLLHSRTLVVFLEYVQNKGSGQRVNLEMLFLINHITDGKCASVELALQRIFFSAADDLF